ncbi:NAD(P)H-binding protein [Stakelama sp. CBK3Z-3]|uniref:NAD(P)H-binding protein n=1 Tax=Stakelama flava TaxID=2860338 RepID=A0ABS6XIQ8_9SPHN|nr:NAD(P)H-binding protein [Stakelama flava]MBW4330098.1 NAD(P)H-binding protein [Stakelama flava]
MIVISAPTSGIGSRLLDHLLEAGETVRVIARDSSGLPAATREKVEVIEGSHSDAEIITRALEGADALFWLVPANPKASSVMEAYVEFSRPAVDAIKAQGVGRVVNISALGRTTSLADHAGYVTGSLAVDDMFADTGVNFRALTMPSYMDNMLMQADPIREKGMFFSPISGDLKLPSCARRDIAAVAARFLRDTQWTGQQEQAVLGPENISFNDMAEIMSATLGKTVRFQQIPLDAYKDQFLGFGFSDAMAQGMTDMADAKNEGLDLGVERTPDNTTPTSFADWCETVLKPALAN